MVFIIPIKIIRTKYCIYLEKKKYKFVSRFFLHIMQPNIVKYFAIFITIVFHKKFLLLSSWTLVYFTHHLFYNEYFFFFFPFFLFQNFPAVSINRWKWYIAAVNTRARTMHRHCMNAVHTSCWGVAIQNDCVVSRLRAMIDLILSAAIEIRI